MTRKCLILLCSLSFLVAVNAAGQFSHIKNIVGSDHDLSSTSPANIHAASESEICFFCHAPHQALNTKDTTVTNAPNTQAPLWNHYLSSTTSYGVYSSTSFNALGTDIADLGAGNSTNIAGSAAVSNLCLSCHDGTVGVNVLYHGQYGTGSPSMFCGSATAGGANSPCLMPDGALIGNPNTVAGTKSLADLHPINFTYDSTLAGKTVDLVTPVANSSGIGGTRMGVPGSNGSFLPLFQTVSVGTYKMQCPTCHDVHNGNPNARPFLRDSTTGSALCLDCHGA